MILFLLRRSETITYGWTDFRGSGHIDYHVELHGHYYSVPYEYAGKDAEIRYTPSVVEIFHEGVRIASHVRDDTKGRATTNPEPTAPRHRHYLEWTPERSEIGSRAPFPREPTRP